MKELILMKEILAFLKRLKKFIIESEKLDVIYYLETLISDLENSIIENEKRENKYLDFEL